MCSFGGKILPRPSDGKLRYVGGETRLISIHKNFTWCEFTKRTLKVFNQAHIIKYQLPGEELDALISVSSDEDLQNMMEEYYNGSDGSPRLRIFLIEIERDGTDGTGTGTVRSDYVEAVNNTVEPSPRKSTSAENLGFFTSPCASQSPPFSPGPNPNLGTGTGILYQNPVPVLHQRNLSEIEFNVGSPQVANSNRRLMRDMILSPLFVRNDSDVSMTQSEKCYEFTPKGQFENNSNLHNVFSDSNLNLTLALNNLDRKNSNNNKDEFANCTNNNCINDTQQRDLLSMETPIISSPLESPVQVQPKIAVNTENAPPLIALDSTESDEILNFCNHDPFQNLAELSPNGEPKENKIIVEDQTENVVIMGDLSENMANRVIVEDVTNEVPPGVRDLSGVVPHVNEGSNTSSLKSEDGENQGRQIEGTITDAIITEIEAGKYGLQIIKNVDLEELRELGSGTFGTVYHGKWRGSDVAIKRIKKSCFSGRSSEQDKLTRDFWREAQILSRVHHPNVVAFYGVVPDGPE